MLCYRLLLIIVGLWSSTLLRCYTEPGKMWVSDDHQKSLHYSNENTPLRNYSVGFSLSASYGAAAVIIDEAHGKQTTLTWVVYGDASYQKVMGRLSLDSSRHIAPPYDDMQQYFDDQPRVIRRKLRMEAGLPASDDVGSLATVIKELRSQIESDLEISVADATLSAIHLEALYQDDIEDICEYAGFKYIIPKNLYKPFLWETSSTYAGYGFGLCEHWQNDTECLIENKHMPDIPVLAVHYSRTVLTSTLAQLRTALNSWEGYGRRLEDFTLGSDAKAWYPNEEKYWHDVKVALVRRMVEMPYMKRPEKIIVTGDMISDEFIRALEEALRNLMGEVPPIILHDTVIIAAKGAAELRRRGQAPWQT